MSAEQTDSQIHSLHVRYFVQLVLYQIMITIQITLIIATIIKFKKKQKQNHLTDAERRTNDHIRFLFISVLVTGSIVFALVEWYGVADFLYDFAAWYKYCDVAAILGNLSILTYLLALYLFFLYRLHATFQKSAIQLTPFHAKILLTITFGVYFIMVILIFLWQKGAVAYTPFAWNMKKKDWKPIIICEGEFSIGIDSRLRWALQGIVIIGNVYYGWMFYSKLYDLLKFIQKQTEKNISVDTQSQKIMKLMNKQTTLVMVSTVSTSIFWTLANVLHYFGSYLQILVYLDISINCLCLFLMFAWNDKVYKRICKPCILMNSCCCSTCFKSEIIKEIEKAIELNSSKQKTSSKGSTQNELHFHAYQTSSKGSKGAQNESTKNDVEKPETSDVEMP